MQWQAFDAIYLINLPERTDRKRELEGELRNVGFQIGEPRLVWIRAVRPAEAGQFPSIGARGCFLSHLACLQSALKHDHRRILILEDDAQFPKARVHALRGVLEKLPLLQWSLWYGGGSLHLDPALVNDGIDVMSIDHTLGVQSTHCVAFQGDAIAAMLSFLELILTRPGGHPDAGPMHVDGAYSTWRARHPSAVTLVCMPPVCVQRSSRSDIASTRWYDKTPLVEKTIAAGRRLRNYLTK